jgi:hypothetical protein
MSASKQPHPDSAAAGVPTMISAILELTILESHSLLAAWWIKASLIEHPGVEAISANCPTRSTSDADVEIARNFR